MTNPKYIFNLEALDVGKSITVRQTIELKAITIENVKKDYAQTVMSLDEWRDEFNNVCPDYKDAVLKEVPSFALDFATNVIYKIGPQSRDKSIIGNTRWNFTIPAAVGPPARAATTFSVCSLKSTEKLDTQDNLLNVKKATLLATRKFNEAAVIIADDDKILMTPLAGAIYNSDIIKKYATASKENLGQSVAIFNSSCCPFGHLLPESDGNIAAAAAIIATDKLSNTKIRDNIISKVIKQYAQADKEPAQEEVTLLCAMAGTNGTNFNIDKLLNDYKALKISPQDKFKADVDTYRDSTFLKMVKSTKHYLGKELN